MAPCPGYRVNIYKKYYLCLPDNSAADISERGGCFPKPQ